jgi:carbon-monoxide dehydrogenase medium subunit
MSGEERVKPAPFAYAKARSVEDAVALLAQHGDDAKLLAGGQSLIATLNMRLSAPKLLIDLNGVDGISGVDVIDGEVHIGAMTRHTDIERSDLIAHYAPLIAAAVPHIAHPAIRNRGTIGGSIAFADPAAELPACLLALGGSLEVAGPKGRRTIAADEFFKGLYETALTPDEVLTKIRLPAATSGLRVGFAELSRRHGDYAIVGLAATAQAAGDKLTNVRLAFFGVDITPVRAKGAEDALAAGDIDKAAAALASDLDPLDDVQETGAVKRHLAGVLLRRVAKQVKGHAHE